MVNQSSPHTDTRFFTNADNDTLVQRFRDSLASAQYFDVLVGYFRATGFHLLRDALKDIEKIRILVGLSVDAQIFQASQHSLPIISHHKAREVYASELQVEVENAADSFNTEDSLRTFMQWLSSGKIELRGHPSSDLHAKVYISRYRGNLLYGSVITGSSNFSASGFEAQHEFNVELKDRSDVDFALSRFECLWAQGIELNESFVATVTNKTWLNDTITPYEIYLKVLYEYFQEDINLDAASDMTLPDGMYNLEYQRQAVTSATRILNMHNGVFFADVVGLGKTYITALLLQQQAGRKLVICPPVLKEYWQETLYQFAVFNADVVSLGKLEQLATKNLSKYSLVVVDEAHRFRNENTRGHELLQNICAGKKVVLLSATPLNNRMEDILAQLKLFQASRQSTIPGVSNLQHFFTQRAKDLKSIPKTDPAYPELVQRTATLVRDKVLKHVMVRRTRSEVRKYFSKDLENQGLYFPEMGAPERIVYSFDTTTAKAFDATIESLKNLSYARYKPLLYLEHPIDARKAQGQHNISGFMKKILVKRLESSFHAFKGTVQRFMASHEVFLRMFDSGTIYMGKKINAQDLLDIDDDSFLSTLEAQTEQGDNASETYAADMFKSELRTLVRNDLQTLQYIASIWKDIEYDPKLTAFCEALQHNKLLMNEKLLVFTESQETAAYIATHLESIFPSEVMLFSSKGGELFTQNEQGAVRQSLGIYDARQRILRNFDPSHEAPENSIRILVTTDVLAEGINLHRAGRIINYDLPWNPTRVMQRVGRINRVGSKHATLHVCNFFPTATTDEHLGLEQNIINKINAFHTILGEDDRYLSEDEEPTPQGLFGQQLLRRLEDKNSLEGEEELDSELKYLAEIRQIRDTNQDLFDYIKKLPRKARSARTSMLKHHKGLMVFFRQGLMKKFVFVPTEASLPHENPIREYTFMEAAAHYACAVDETKQTIPKDYFKGLQMAKYWLEEQDNEGDFNPTTANTDRNLMRMLKALCQRRDFTDTDIAYINKLLQIVEQGRLAKATMKRIYDGLNKAMQKGPANCLATLREHMPEVRLQEYETPTSVKQSPTREIILAEYLL